MKRTFTFVLLFTVFITFTYGGCNKNEVKGGEEIGGKTKGVKTETLTDSDIQEIKKIAEDFVLKMARGNKNAQIKVLKVTDSVIPGVAKVRVEWKQGGYGKRFNLYVTNDGNYIFMGPIVPANGDLSGIQSEEVDFVDESMINTKGAPSMGPKDAPVRIVEFADFQCPYCGMMYNTMKQVMEHYKGKINFTYKHFPLSFHKWAEPAALAAQCAYNQKPEAFWDFYNYFYQNQREFNPQNIEEKSIEEAKKIGLNVRKFKKCLKDPSTKNQIKKSFQDGLKLQVRSTPTLFINGRYIPGALPFNQIKSIIDRELQK